MAVTVSYEVLSFKEGKWEAILITNDKDEALSYAHDYLKSRFFKAIRVIEEKYDEETGEAIEHIVLNKKKGVVKKAYGYTGPERRVGRRIETKKKVPGDRRKKTTFFAEIIKLVLILGGYIFGLVLLLMIYVVSKS